MRNLILFWFSFILICFGLFADTISIEEVRLLALTNSRSLAKYNLSIQSIALDERSRVYSNFPSLSLGVSASISLWNAERAEPIENPFDTFSAGASVSISQRIFEGGKSFIQKTLNEIAAESARKDALAEYFNVLDSADNAYYALLEAAATLEAEEASLLSSNAALSIAEIRQASGIISQGDFLKALAEMEGRENSRNQARRNLVLANAKLRAITGLSDIPSLEPVDFSGYEELILLLGTISDEEADFLYSQFWKLLMIANPSLSKASLSHQRAESNLNMTKSSYSPTLSASFSTGLNYTQNNGLERSGGRLSLSASIPVDFWVIANNVEKSRVALDSALIDYISAEAQLDSELQSALINTFGYAGSFLSSRRSLEYAERHFEYVMERYRLTQASVSELGEASTLLINSRNNNIKMSFSFLQSLSKLRSLAAIDDEERLIEFLMSK